MKSSEYDFPFVKMALVELTVSLVTNLVPRVSPSQREQGKKDPGLGWSRASQIVGGDKNIMEGRCNQVTIVSFLNSLYSIFYVCHSH